MQSLLNQKQSVWAKEMLSNVRLACCVAGGMNLVPKEEDVLEVREVGHRGTGVQAHRGAAAEAMWVTGCLWRLHCHCREC